MFFVESMSARLKYDDDDFLLDNSGRCLLQMVYFFKKITAVLSSTEPVKQAGRSKLSIS
jgi:hypothetical protein